LIIHQTLKKFYNCLGSGKRDLFEFFEGRNFDEDWMGFSLLGGFIFWFDGDISLCGTGNKLANAEGVLS